MVKTLNQKSYLHLLSDYIIPGREVKLIKGFPASAFVKNTRGLKANAYYFGEPEWAEGWLKYVHRSPLLAERWKSTGGSWDDKVVVDIGCGPGNLQTTLNDSPKTLIGVDVSLGTLKYAVELGYIPLLADAHALPLKSEIADIVALNSTLHHVDEMDTVLEEAARLVKPGGVLIADHDPQKSATMLRFLGKLLWILRMPVYRYLNKGGHRALNDEQAWAKATEIHHKPGDGVTKEMFKSILEPAGFEVTFYPHNGTVGKEIMNGDSGEKPFKYRIAQILSGINPNSEASALILMCVARRKQLR
jgi:ubiquinone/menaquinone biosynthesis C-methylase UbiE